VMLIIALVASLVVTMMPGTGRAGLKALTLQTASLLRRERLGAMMTGRERGVSLDGERRVLVGEGGDAVALPPDVALDILGIDALRAGRLAVVRFHPDGASTGAVLKLSREKTEYEIRVNWYTSTGRLCPTRHAQARPADCAGASSRRRWRSRVRPTKRTGRRFTSRRASRGPTVKASAPKRYGWGNRHNDCLPPRARLPRVSRP